MTSDPAELARLRAWLGSTLIAYDVPAADCGKLLLAVGELCANAIEHAYDRARGHPIHVSVDLSREQLVIEVEDWGRPFDPERYVPPDLSAAPEGGLGVYLVNEIADHVACDTDRTAGTRWTLTKRRTPPAAESP